MKRPAYPLPQNSQPKKKWANIANSRKVTFQDFFIDRNFNGTHPNNVGKPTAYAETPPVPYKGRCWWDEHDFTGPVIQCPIAYHPQRKCFKSTGGFCSWNCALSWGEKQSGIEQVRKNCGFWIYMITKTHFKRAPSKLFLKAYGGPMTIEEFRATFGQFQRSFDVFPFGHVPFTYNLWTFDRSESIGKSLNHSQPTKIEIHLPEKRQLVETAKNQFLPRVQKQNLPKSTAIIR